jgi:hypothetical protein
MIRSWFPNRIRQPDYELPMWQSIQPAIPRPVMASIHMPPAREHSRQSAPPSDDLLLLRKKEELLQETLQELLDAQADGLMAGLGAALTDDQSSVGNLTPTTQSMRSLSLSPSPQGSRRKLGLGPARRAIWKTILECAAVKADEDALIREELEQNYAILEELDRWNSRRTGLKKQITEIEQQDTATKAQSLQKEADSLLQDIIDTEQRLARMRTRHRQLFDEISELENSVQSKLSSYKSSLAMLEKDVDIFLANPPIKSSMSSRKDDSTFVSLPPKRRTLDMARDYWESEYTELRRRRKVVKRGRTALEEGAVVWRDTIAEITTFERFLQKESKGLGPVNGKGKDRAATTDPADIIARMNKTIQVVEQKLKLAESKKWKLLEVCIGAELEAFKEGKELLEATFMGGHDSQSGLENWSETSPPGDSGFEQDEDEDVSERALDAHGAGLHQRMIDTDDDEPSADLMVSHQDDDTE